MKKITLILCITDGYSKQAHKPCTTTSGLTEVENLLFKGSISPVARNPYEERSINTRKYCFTEDFTLLLHLKVAYLGAQILKSLLFSFVESLSITQYATQNATEKRITCLVLSSEGYSNVPPHSVSEKKAITSASQVPACHTGVSYVHHYSACEDAEVKVLLERGRETLVQG